MNHIAYLLLSLFLFSTLNPTPVFSQIVKQPHVEAELVASKSEILPGTPLLVALRLKMQKDWHTYWRNPGDSGESTQIQWKLPAGFTAGEILWPAPHRIPVPPLINFGYSDEVFLLTEISPSNRAPDQTHVTIRAHATWLVCNEICIPGKAELSLTLPWAQSSSKDSAWFGKLDEARSSVPVASPEWKSRLNATRTNLQLTLRGPTNGIQQAIFYPYSETLIQNGAEQKGTFTDGKIVLEIPRSQFSEGALRPDELGGIVVFNAGAIPSIEIAPKLQSGSSGFFWEALLLAFLGGVILNLMPCVFPVLCLKVLSFVQSKGARKKQLHHAGAYTMGVLVSFWLLAGTLIVLRSGGQALGWGFQLQSPLFLTALAFLLTAMALNLFGVFEFGDSLMGTGQNLAKKDGWLGAFFSGVLATVVATPCTAPFMGSAMGYALAQPALPSLAVFTFLGLGLSAPYALFSVFPQFTRWLPKPGAWMVVFKQLMAFPLLLTVWWLVSVLALQSSIEAVFQILLALVFFGAGLWVYGLPTRRKVLQTGIALTLIAGSVVWVLREIRNAKPASLSASAESTWQPFSDSALRTARLSGRPVFIDFTAAWCITCQVNEKVALNTQAVQERFAQKNVILFKADWTNQDEAIARRLESYGRNGVPLYVLYPPGEFSEPRILPQLLTPEIVYSFLEAL